MVVVVEVRAKKVGPVPRREQRKNIDEMTGFLRSVPDIKCDSDKGGCCVSGDYSAVVSALKGTREYMNSKNPGKGDFQESFEIIARSTDGTQEMKEALEAFITPTYGESPPSQLKELSRRGRSSSSDGIVQVMPDIPERKRVFSYDGSHEQKEFYEEWHTQY
ncbi:hypothetical protein Pmar_PMAR003976 [Perkinsus marinus ATCC 50983]|uniref:Uncharacterized protein n=1 Tax=Perkinsus marinus (strain ATCC 50983 / TXsc) TaxID=423536 RepID=C5L940_PERM5|nr:hypothetical protein Pmar_PMAR003976 [Perkinsus marinus ATCC 50983]EER06753.1 hypothetical protein Pmar_PMAR003976 [Perkinsus marinus ATCC 50983]|eukprot:XP_002774937.1 hypothetical protein Pmar_PMAR003976 [Perkinsus marinus ATCC 50983]